ncbi:MAG: hypothetical protein H7Y01_14275 [Ferruginibacter sp.]|nr:hypothetical protein [Chitinophagaceae bacterium]
MSGRKKNVHFYYYFQAEGLDGIEKYQVGSPKQGSIFFNQNHFNMKKNYLIGCGLPTFIIIVSVLLFSVAAHSQDLTEEQKQERCQNNKNRIVELETQLRVINAELSQTMEKKEMEDARQDMFYVRIFKVSNNNLNIDPLNKSDLNFKRIESIGAQYNWDFEKCIYKGFREGEKPYYVPKFCYSELEKIIAKKIDKAVSLDRPALLAKKNETEKQLAAHRNNLIALRCDQPTGACKLEGVWTQNTPGIGSTDWKIESDGTANERGIGYAKGKATLSGNVLHIDWQTNTGYSGYYEWTLDGNCSSVKGTLVFKTGRTDNLNSTVKRN